MVASNKNTPVLRFKEFKDDWEKKNLGEVFSIFNGYAFSSNDSKETGCRWVKIADVGINEMNHDSTSYLPADYTEKFSKYLLREGDYVVALTRPILQGKLKIARIDKELDRSLLNQRVGKIVSQNNLTFVYSLLQKESLIARIENRIAGTDPPNLSPNEIDTLHQFLPSLPEQQKIASFLSSVDEKIQQLTRKKELLEQYKKGVMQQLFSRKLRFKDEHGKDYPEWEDKRLGEVCDINPVSSELPDSFIYVDLESVESGRLIKENRINKIGAPSRAQRVLKTKDILYQTVRPYQMNNLFFDTVGDYVASTGYAQLRAKGNTMFLFQLLHADYFRNEVIDRCTGTSFPAINSKDLSKIKVSIPPIQEQQKIGTFLSNIDTKIKTITTQITQTQTFKKGLLQQMFV